MSVKIDKILHIQLHRKATFSLSPHPWFGQEQNAKLTIFSMLLNFASCMKVSILENENSLLEELGTKQFYKPKKCLLSQLTLFFICYI